MSKQSMRYGACFVVITLLVWGCSGEPFGGPLFGAGGAAGASSGGQAGAGGSAGSGGSAGQPLGGQAGQDAGAPDVLPEPQPEAATDAPVPDASPEAATDAALPECAQCKCANQSGQWCGPKPPEPSSDLACSTVTPFCCFCPGHCVRTGCVYSPANPIGGHTWMCCKAGV